MTTPMAASVGVGSNAVRSRLNRMSRFYRFYDFEALDNSFAMTLLFAVQRQKSCCTLSSESIICVAARLQERAC